MSGYLLDESLTIAPPHQRLLICNGYHQDPYEIY